MSRSCCAPSTLQVLAMPAPERDDTTDPAQIVARRLAARPADPAPEDAPPTPSRRRRLWELPRSAFCPVIGTCLSLADLRRLAEPWLGPRPQAAVSDYELHCSAIAECGQRGALSERLQRELDQRHATAIRQIRAIRDPAALARHWAEAARGGEVGAALWATLTHPCCSTTLEEQVQRDIHMLQHQTGAGARADLRRLRELVQENAVLTRELASIQARVTRQMADSTARIERQQAELIRLRAALIARDSALQALRDDQAARQADPPPALARLDLTRRIASLQTQVRALQAEVDAGRTARARAAEAPAPRPDAGIAAAPATDAGAATGLRDKAVLCVGGRTASVPIYRRIVETRGARFAHHDGGEEDGAAMLDTHLAAADLVICQAGCVSHGAYWRVKDHCRRTGKPCVFVERPSASGLVRGLASVGLDATLPAGQAGPGGG